MYDVVVKKFTFAISSPDEFLLKISCRTTDNWQQCTVVLRFRIGN